MAESLSTHRHVSDLAPAIVIAAMAWSFAADFARRRYRPEIIIAAMAWSLAANLRGGNIAPEIVIAGLGPSGCPVGSWSR